MKQKLQTLQQILSKVDENPTESLKFYSYSTPPAFSGHINTKQEPDNKYILLETALHHIAHHEAQNDNCTDVDCERKTSAFLQTINSLYVRYQHLCWPSHTHHFHVDFYSYCRCPVTCLTEIIEFLEKIQKEVYGA